MQVHCLVLAEKVYTIPRPKTMMIQLVKLALMKIMRGIIDFDFGLDPTYPIIHDPLH